MSPPYRCPSTLSPCRLRTCLLSLRAVSVRISLSHPSRRLSPLSPGRLRTCLLPPCRLQTCLTSPVSMPVPDGCRRGGNGRLPAAVSRDRTTGRGQGEGRGRGAGMGRERGLRERGRRRGRRPRAVSHKSATAELGTINVWPTEAHV